MVTQHRQMLGKGVAAILCLQALTLASFSADAASATGAAAAVIVANPSAVSAVQNFEVGISPQSNTSQQSDIQVNVPTTLGRTSSSLTTTSVSQPASFAVSGEPNQVFSVTVPQAATAVASDGEPVAFSDFKHDAGLTPTIGAEGVSVFSVGATAQLKLSQGGDLGEASGPSGDDFGDLEGFEDGVDVTLEDAVASDEDDSEIVPLRRVSAFGIIAASDGFMNVLISYN